MVKIALVSYLAAAEAGKLAVTWSDCGAKHAKVTDLQPTSVATGTTEALVGSGTVDEDVTKAKFTATIKAAGATLATCSGDGTADIECKLPLGAGVITVKALTFPIKKGAVKIPVTVKTSSFLPPSLAKVDVHVAATDQNGEDVICLDVHTAKGSFDDIRVASGKYVMGEYGSHCPSGAADITSKSDCQEAVTSLGRSYSGDADNWNIPRGCLTWSDKQAVYNDPLPGGGEEAGTVARLCKQSTEDLDMQREDVPTSKAMGLEKRCDKTRTYAQCGGYTYKGETCCPKGRGCRYMQPEYSQCDVCAEAYGQCGGGPGYNGSTCCPTSFTCKASGAYYSGCVAKTESVDLEVAQSLGAYMASWVRAQEGKHIDRGECWDLANEAIKHARTAGFKVPSSPSTYAWSSQTVNYKNAQPGDILQFVSYGEKTAHGSKSTGSHHTAVVVKSFDSASCGIEVEEQNPKPVHDSVYHPCSRTGGSMTVYRMSASMMDETVVV